MRYLGFLILSNHFIAMPFLSLYYNSFACFCYIYILRSLLTFFSCLCIIVLLQFFCFKTRGSLNHSVMPIVPKFCNVFHVFFTSFRNVVFLLRLLSTAHICLFCLLYSAFLFSSINIFFSLSWCYHMIVYI